MSSSNNHGSKEDFGRLPSFRKWGLRKTMILALLCLMLTLDKGMIRAITSCQFQKSMARRTKRRRAHGEKDASFRAQGGLMRDKSENQLPDCCLSFACPFGTRTCALVHSTIDYMSHSSQQVLFRKPNSCFLAMLKHFVAALAFLQLQFTWGRGKNGIGVVFRHLMLDTPHHMPAVWVSSNDSKRLFLGQLLSETLSLRLTNVSKHLRTSCFEFRKSTLKTNVLMSNHCWAGNPKLTAKEFRCARQSTLRPRGCTKRCINQNS